MYLTTFHLESSANSSDNEKKKKSININFFFFVIRLQYDLVVFTVITLWVFYEKKKK